MRKSFKIAPGVRVSVSKSGVGASVGTRGARYSVHSSGRRTASVGVSGTGIGWTSTASGAGRPTSRALASNRPASAPSPAAPPKPGLFAPKGEKALYKLINAGSYSPGDLEALARQHPDHWLPAATLPPALRRAQAVEVAASLRLALVGRGATPLRCEPEQRTGACVLVLLSLDDASGLARALRPVADGS